MRTGLDPRSRALALLSDLRSRQAKLPRSAALAWERAAFGEVFADPAPSRQIRAFLQKA